MVVMVLLSKKSGGLCKGIQPVQYINPNSPLCKDYSEAFLTSIAYADSENISELDKVLKNYLLHQLLYLKPYSGYIINRENGTKTQKCFTEECEWRFVPQVTIGNYPQIITDSIIIHEKLNEWNNSMIGVAAVSLPFDYEDVKYIILKEEIDFFLFIDALSKLALDTTLEHRLISKVIIWEKSKEDF